MYHQRPPLNVPFYFYSVDKDINVVPSVTVYWRLSSIADTQCRYLYLM